MKKNFDLHRLSFPTVTTVASASIAPLHPVTDAAVNTPAIARRAAFFPNRTITILLSRVKISSVPFFITTAQHVFSIPCFYFYLKS